jgi:O-antigen ligase
MNSATIDPGHPRQESGSPVWLFANAAFIAGPVLLRIPGFLEIDRPIWRLAGLAPFGAIALALAFSPSFKRSLPPARRFLPFILLAVTISFALLRSVDTGIRTTDWAIVQICTWTTWAVFTSVVLWPQSESRRAALLGSSICLYVLTNLILGALGVESRQGVSDATALLWSTLGIERNRVIFPLADGLNNFGAVAGAAILAGAGLWLVSRSSPMRLVGALGALAGLVAALSSDTRAALAFGLLSISVFALPQRLLRIAWFGVLLVPLLPYLFTTMAGSFDIDGGLFARDSTDFSTMNGRATIWETRLTEPFALDGSHIIGHGAFGHVVTGELATFRALFEEGLEIPTLHNMFLQYYVDTGYVGVLIVLVCMYVSLARYSRHSLPRTHPARLTFALTAYAILAGLTEVTGTIYHAESFAIVVMVAAASVPSLSAATLTSRLLVHHRAHLPHRLPDRPSEWRNAS